MTIKEELFALQDISYGDFQSKLIPGIPRELFIGVRVPECRKLAKRLLKEEKVSKFLGELPHKIFKKNKKALLQKIKEWSISKKAYTCRFGIKMLMTYFLDEDFKPEYLEIPASVHSKEYYVQMMIAWFFATALAKQWNTTIKYIDNRQLDTKIHNMAIQKARESNRITSKQKEYLKLQKIRNKNEI